MDISSKAHKVLGLGQVLKSRSILQITALLVTVVFMRWVVRGIYRVYFHPLSRFPGPKFSAFTRIPHIFAIFNGSLHTYVARLHDQYGDIVRISPDELSFLNPQAWRDIYSHGSKTNEGTVPPKYLLRYVKDPSGTPSILNTPDNTEHSRLRKIFFPAFSERALTQQEPLFTKYVDQLVKVLKAGIAKSNNEGEEASFDMVRLYNFTTFDIMGDLTFGESLHMLTGAEYDPWVREVFDFIKTAVISNAFEAHYPLVITLVKPLLAKAFGDLQDRHYSFSETRVTKRLTMGRESAGVDLWDLVMGQEDKGKPLLSRDQMNTHANMFMLAGTETTSTLLSGLTYLLLDKPECMAKLVKEIRGTFKEDGEISMQAAAKLPYLKACISEALRMYPPVPNGMPHLTPRDGSTVCGEFVPAKTIVSVPQFAICISPKLFKDPLSFVPERWTGDARFAADDRSASQPFSIGPRDCLGKNMAYHEIRLVLTKVLWNFDLELSEENKGWLEQQVFVLWQKTPLMVKVKVARR
ncbi:cytochrome P450 46A1 [Clathrospora elynae]|uniref:Cytochrome P450 46A1 n=1 Tax=Clathrospora elynae TaxID=706981 RepID=A0A6A5SIP2_9PLEO|nr:cytochrome P450 46A1 [Clathrospora elynae]